MDRISILLAVFLLVGVSAFGQQDPNQPGVLDSVIISTILIQEPTDSVEVDVFITTGDSVIAVEIPLSLNGARIMNESFGWSFVESVFSEPVGRVRIKGSGTPIFTKGRRQRLCSLRLKAHDASRYGLIHIRSGIDNAIFHAVDDSIEYSPAFRSGYVVLHFRANERIFRDIQSILITQDYSPVFDDTHKYEKGLILDLDHPQLIHLVFYEGGFIDAGCFEDSLEAGRYYVIVYGKSVPREDPEAKLEYCCITNCAVITDDGVDVRPIRRIKEGDLR